MPQKIALAISDESLINQCGALLVASDAAYETLITTVPVSMAALQQESPELVVLNINDYPDSELLFHVGLITSTMPDVPVLLLVESDQDEHLLDALSAGAKGYLCYSQLDAFFTKAIDKVGDGEAWVPRKMVSKILCRLVELTGQHQPPLSAIK